MSFKDYYKILESHPQASSAELKKAYRNLARRYHPDSNSTDPKATQYFQEIQSAYEILSNPLKRKVFDNELKAKGQYSTFAKDNINSAEQILKQSQDLFRYIDTQYQKSINSDALVDFILGLLNEENLALLIRRNDFEMNTQVLISLISSSKPVTSYRLYLQLAERFFCLFPNPDSEMHQKIAEELDLRKKRDKQEKLVPFISFIIVLIIIILMLMILFMNQ